MTTIDIVRSTGIDRPSAEVIQFLKLVPNLPLWTRFFLVVRGDGHGAYAVETIRGPGLTNIAMLPSEPSFALLQIQTRFSEVTETAELKIEKGTSTRVTFLLHLPSGASPELVNRAAQILEDELETLRSALEAPNLSERSKATA